jgi:ribosome maturation factor RimP
MELNERIAQLLEEKFTTDEAFNDCFTVEIELKPGNKLYVFTDSDSGMTFEKCQKLSRYLEQHLDTNGWLGDQYLLEVSSPGITRPLKFLRQYVKNIGRLVDVTMKDKSQLSGVLKTAGEEGIVLAYTVTEKVEKKKITRDVETPVSFEQIEKTVVKITF